MNSSRAPWINTISGLGVVGALVLGPAMARPGGGGGNETPCYVPLPGGTLSCLFWTDLTNPAECPDEFRGGSGLPDVTEGSPGHDNWIANGVASCQVRSRFLDEERGPGCHVGPWTTEIMSGRIPSGNSC